MVSNLSLTIHFLCSENGQISGKVLVYRNPGLHFGDIHILNAKYVEKLEEFVGNAKYGIFFSTKGRRSVGSEIANGDFDGDLYWVSRSPQVGIQFFFSFLDFLFYINGPCRLPTLPDITDVVLHVNMLRVWSKCFITSLVLTFKVS